MANEPDPNQPDRPRLGPDDRYRIRRELGRGMMGVVWEAEDTLLGRTVAIKTIELAFGVALEAREPFERRFFAEARAAAQLSHPGIVVCHDVGKDPASGRLFIVFEHLKGCTLAERVAAGPMPWREALPVAVSVARAVHHAHEHGVFHRDLKPANVMLPEAGAAEADAGAAAKIMDFGVAHVESAEPRLTVDGDRFGSPAYMSPEMTLGMPSDARSDIFSIGSILCTMLLGREWFAASSIPTTLQRVVHQDAPVLSAFLPEVPRALDPVVARAMAKRPEDRHASAAELAEDLEDVLAGRAPRHTALPKAAQDDGVGQAADTEASLSELVALVGAGPARPDTDVPDPLAALVEQLPAPPAEGTRRGTGSPAALRLGAAAALALVLLVPIVVFLLRQKSPPAPPAALALPATATPLPGPTVAPPASSPPAASPATAPRPPARPAATAQPRRSPDTLTGTPEAEAPLPTPPAAEALRDAAGQAPAGQAPPGQAPAGQARIRVDVEHPLDSGHLTVWVDGGLAFDTKLQAETAKKIVALTFRKGHLEKMLDVSPGRHELRVEVRWETERRVASTVADVAPGSTGLLEVRLGRMTRELRLTWSRLAGG